MKHSTTRTDKHTPALARLLVAFLLAFACSTALPQTTWADDGSEATDSPSIVATQMDLPIDTGSVPTFSQTTSPDEAASPEAAPASGQPEPAGQLTSEPVTSPAEQPATMAEGPSDVEDGQNTLTATSTFAYEHDPRDNPSAMADIIEDENAVYGFSPSPNGSLKDYAGYDWSDPDVVEGGRQQRIAYHESFSELYGIIDQMQADGATSEQIARAVSTRRNELRLESYRDDPDGLAAVKARNLEVYGNENGGTPEYFYRKYGSWEKVIEKSLSVNSGMDACTGLYDIYYALYVAAGQVPPDEPVDGNMDDIAPVVITGTGDSVTAASREDQEHETAYDSVAAVQPLPATGEDLPSALPTALLLMGSTLTALGIRLRRAA